MRGKLSIAVKSDGEFQTFVCANGTLFGILATGDPQSFEKNLLTLTALAELLAMAGFLHRRFKQAVLTTEKL